MLAVGFTDVVVAIHVMAVVAGLGVVFAYPVLMPWMRRHHPGTMPALHDAQDLIGRRLISPGLAVILIAGIYLASKEDVWSKVWVSVPLLILLVIGGLGGAYFTPKTRRLAELARRDLQRGSELSGEYDALFAQVRTVGLVMAGLVLIAIFFMVTKPGA